MGPFPDRVEILALVLCHKIWESRVNAVNPYLTEHVKIDCAHELLAKDIETVACKTKVSVSSEQPSR